MEFKGTKGEWNIFFNGFFHDIRVDGQSLASTQQNSFLFIDKDIELANAKLIVCAPEMLDALVHIEDYVTRSLTLSGHSKKDIDYILRKVRPVIKKATE